MRLIDADALKKRFKEHYDLFVSAYKNVQDMNLADKSRVDEMLNSVAEVTNAPKIKVEIVVFEKESRKVLADIKQGDVSITRSDIDFRIFTDTEPIFTDKNGSVYFDDKWIMQIGEENGERLKQEPYIPKCHTCKHLKNGIVPCNRCKDNSEYEPKESEDKE